MNSFEFGNPVKLLLGKGKIASLADLIHAGTRVMIIYGEGLLGVTAFMNRSLRL